jgi:hypothetical protein
MKGERINKGTKTISANIVMAALNSISKCKLAIKDKVCYQNNPNVETENTK